MSTVDKTAREMLAELINSGILAGGRAVPPPLDIITRHLKRHDSEPGPTVTPKTQLAIRCDMGIDSLKMHITQMLIDRDDEITKAVVREVGKAIETFNPEQAIANAVHEVMESLAKAFLMHGPGRKVIKDLLWTALSKVLKSEYNFDDEKVK